MDNACRKQQNVRLYLHVKSIVAIPSIINGVCFCVGIVFVLDCYRLLVYFMLTCKEPIA